MKRPAVILLLLVLGAVLLLQATPSLPAVSEPAPLAWDGRALTGQPYYERVFDHLVIHYTRPTRADVVEKFAQELQMMLNRPSAVWLPLLPDERLHVWVVPRGLAWPAGLIRNAFVAVGPRTLIVSGHQLPDPDRLARMTGFDEAFAVAMSQPEGSPAFAVPWIHNGYGRAMSIPLQHFPGGLYQQNYESGGLSRTFPPLDVDYILEGLTKHDGAPEFSLSDASGAVVGLLIDRWGPTWWEYYPGDVTKLTAMEAIRWATDAADDDQARDRFTVRMQQVVRWHYAVKDDANVGRSITLNDQGQNRIPPALRQLPTPGDNHSPHSYQFDVAWDPATRTVSGEEVLTWQNGEGVPIDRLYFNLWGNALGAAWHLGYTKVEAVTVDGQAVDFRAKGMDLEVPLGREVQPGQQVQVSLRYRTRLPGSRPAELMLWYPALARLDEEGWHPDSFAANGRMSAEPAEFQVRLSVPTGTKVTTFGPEPSLTEDRERWVYQFSDSGLTEWAATFAP